MNLYAFELGREKKLCLAELISVLGEGKLVEKNNNTAIFKIENFSNEQALRLQNKLGGTIKIIKIVGTFPSLNLNSIKAAIQSLLENHFKNHKGKVPFAISVLNFKNPRVINIKELLNFSKKILKSLGFNCRFVNKNFKNPPSSTIYKAKVIEKGIDINLIKGTLCHSREGRNPERNNKFYLGHTITIQNIDSYSARDYGKPKRDARVGMLPPKLAQMMINLAGGDKKIYDPFCGTGTILTEGMLMGLDVIGSDNSDRMIEYSNVNCEWIEQKFRTKTSYKIFEQDAQKIDKEKLDEKIDAIITEGYLGEPQSSIPAKEKRDEIFKELLTLHKNWLSAAKNILRPGNKIVMCKTAFKVKDKIEHMNGFLECVKELGYEIEQTFTYERPNQIVVRDIIVLSA